MGKMTLKLYVFLFLGLFSMGAKCQEVALKSNLLYDVFATLNAGVEVGLADRWTLDVSANYNGWTLSHTGSGNTGFCNRGTLLVLRSVGGSFCGCACPCWTIQCGKSG